MPRLSDRELLAGLSGGLAAVALAGVLRAPSQDLVTTILADEQNHLRTFEGFLPRGRA